MTSTRGGSGTSRTGDNGGGGAHYNSRWGQYAAELRILLVYLSESLGRLGQNVGPLGAHFSLGAAAPLPRVEPPLTSTMLGRMVGVPHLTKFDEGGVRRLEGRGSTFGGCVNA